MLMRSEDKRKKELQQLRNEKKAIERTMRLIRAHKVRAEERVLDAAKAYHRALIDIEERIEKIEKKDNLER
ncbi:MAG: hypothetical protein DRO89_04045 [Candidatus Altiarchaeales archaeon]|nr:MAG: hypothetical protein DRO89_04045 [Candidatus Altiarchaeales archaeon]